MSVQHFRITAPEALFSGSVVGVRFERGVAALSVDLDAPRPDGATRPPTAVTALTYFRRKGYVVEEIDSPADVQPETGPVGTPNSRAVGEAEILGIPPVDGQDDGKQSGPPAPASTEDKGAAPKSPAKPAAKTPAKEEK